MKRAVAVQMCRVVAGATQTSNSNVLEVGVKALPVFPQCVQRRCVSVDAPQDRPNSSVVRVRSDTKTSSLSGWLTQRLRESKEPLTLTTIGVSGLNQLVKALSVTQELLVEEGLLYCRASKSETVTEKGAPATYYAVRVLLRPPTDLSHHNVAPNRVGAASHGSAILQIAEAAQKIGQACCLAVAGPTSVQKGIVAISHLNNQTEFIPTLAKNEEGEYTAIHLKILPLPGSAKVVFVSKYTKPPKLAGYLKHMFKEESGTKVAKVIASIDSFESVRAALKACELATDFLENDRIPLTMSVDTAQDDDPLSSGSYVITLTKELAKESTSLRVTVGLGNLRAEKIADMVKGGVEAGRVVHLRATLQGAPTALEALTMLADTCPVTFYSRPKDISEGVNKEKVMSPQAERFFVELMVEKLVIPTRVDFKPNCEAMVQKAVKVHDKFEFHVNDVDRLPRAMKVLQETVEANGGTQLLKMSATNIGIGVTITIEREEWQKERGHQASSIFKPLRFYDGPSAVAESVVRLAMEGDFQCGANGKAQLTSLSRVLAKQHIPFYIIPQSRMNRQGLNFHIPALADDHPVRSSPPIRSSAIPRHTSESSTVHSNVASDLSDTPSDASSDEPPAALVTPKPEE